MVVDKPINCAFHISSEVIGVLGNIKMYSEDPEVVANPVDAYSRSVLDCSRNIGNHITVCKFLSNIRGAIEVVDELYYILVDSDMVIEHPRCVAILSSLDVHPVAIYLLHQYRDNLLGCVEESVG